MNKSIKPFLWHMSEKQRFSVSCYALLALPAILMAVFIYLPVLWAFVNSLFKFEVGGESEFVGLRNYVELFTMDPVIYPAVINMLLLTLFGTAIQITVPLIVAKLIFSLDKERGRYLYRLLFLVPIVAPGVAVQLIWGGMIYNESGMFNEVLRMIGLGGMSQGWLSGPKTALLAIAFVGFPWIGGINVLIYYAGLASIPTSVNEAAKLEGCTGVSKFIRIDIPMVFSQLKLIMVLTIIGGVQTYEGIFILTRGGPGFRTMVPALWMYFNAFSFQRMGYACAVGVCLFFLILGLTLMAFRYVRSTEELEGKA